MALNLDRSIDDILATRPRTYRRGGNKTTVTSGIHKRPKRAATQNSNASNTTRAAWLAKPITGPSGNVAGSKIIVSNLVRPILVATYSYF